MRIAIDENQIFMEAEGGSAPYTIMKKPEVDDYSNLSKRPLVVNYHVVEETVWERAGHLMKALQDTCGDSPYLACYGLLFAQLYPFLLANAQAKNVIGYGIGEGEQVSGLLHDFMTFLQKDSSFILLPEQPFVFSALLDKSCQAAVVSLDRCADLQILCDILSKIRMGGKVFFYTKKEEVPKEAEALLCRAARSGFGSCTVYTLTVDADVYAFAQENNSEAGVLSVAGVLAEEFETFRNLMMAEHPAGSFGEVCALSMKLLWRMEEKLLKLYDVLENPELPVLANRCREALSDCYIGAPDGTALEIYLDRMGKEAQIFLEKMAAEFGF
ncbi:MAG: hypothetical protein NC318_01165 [Blautia sp.]|nr:hypothetical protein [Lachnoclostridium sp.]MCM1210191.1 hypothetical protein [Blautia sp.]